MGEYADDAVDRDIDQFLSEAEEDYGWYDPLLDDPRNDLFASEPPKVGSSCPRCKYGQVTERANHKTGESFLGCNLFPRCRWTFSRYHPATRGYPARRWTQGDVAPHRADYTEDDYDY